MQDQDKTRGQLIRELAHLGQQIGELEAAEIKRHWAEEALRESEERYRALVETAFAGISITDPHENFVFINPALSEMLGYTEDQLIGMNLSQLTEVKEFARYRDFTQQRRIGLRNYYESKLYRRDGIPLNVLISASPLTERDGSFKGVLTVVFDITERRQAVRISVKVATCFGLKVATHRSVATRAFKLTKSGNFASSFSDISGLFSAF